ncbi:19557_t:CDS:1, partial [Racocetra fulgida]
MNNYSHSSIRSVVGKCTKLKAYVDSGEKEFGKANEFAAILANNKHAAPDLCNCGKFGFVASLHRSISSLIPIPIPISPAIFNKGTNTDK